MQLFYAAFCSPRVREIGYVIRQKIKKIIKNRKNTAEISEKITGKNPALDMRWMSFS
jgi:hypothetical protein